MVQTIQCEFRSCCAKSDTNLAKSIGYSPKDEAAFKLGDAGARLQVPALNFFTHFTGGETKEMSMFKLVAFLAVIFLAWSASIGHAQSPKRIEIVAKRFTYDPNTITLKRGQAVVLVLHSIDSYARH